MTSSIPYVEDPRSDTGVTNGAVGIALFLASELMFFGALVASYTLLRISAPAWAIHLGSQTVEVIAATLLLLAASVSISLAIRGSSARSLNAWPLVGAAVLAAAFLVVKCRDAAMLWQSGLVPSTSTAVGLFYAFTGLHALHVAGGGLWALVLALAKVSGKAGRSPGSTKRRVRLLLAYWTFVDLVWVLILGLFYLS